MTFHDDDHHSRRDFLKLGLLGAGTAFAAGFAMATPVSRLLAAEADSSDPYRGFKMGLQSYSLRGFDAPTALKHTRTLGLKYWESFPKHVPTGTIPALVQKNKQMLDSSGVVLLAYGVVEFDANETKAREFFDFAKALGIGTFSANPKKNKQTFDLLDKLVEEYDVAIAIHNHGPGASYDKISDVETFVKDRHPKIGACVDTGHYLRSDEDPVEAIQRLGKRVHGVHLKDVKTVTKDGKSEKIFTILGQGDLKTFECLKALKALDYANCLALEYEENPDNPLSDIEVSLKHVRDAAAKLG